MLQRILLWFAAIMLCFPKQGVRDFCYDSDDERCDTTDVEVQCEFNEEEDDAEHGVEERMPNNDECPDANTQNTRIDATPTVIATYVDALADADSDDGWSVLVV